MENEEEEEGEQADMKEKEENCAMRRLVAIPQKLLGITILRTELNTMISINIKLYYLLEQQQHMNVVNSMIQDGNANNMIY